MSLAVTPAKTCAVVVGIERYDAGDHWNLDGPASDAVRFVDWLCDRGVPVGNILVLLSPLEENRHLGEELAQRSIATQTASHDQIVDALTNRLHRLDGELLFLFWGGHGVITADQKRRLFCANATLTNQQVIGLDDLLARLRSKTCHRFKQQIGIIDACANYFEEMRSKVSLAESGFSRGEPDRDINQFVLYGAATGELAGNDTIRKTGAFSEVVLETLRQDPHWPPDIGGLSEKVKKHFGNLRREGKTRQTPVYFQWQLPGEGEVILGAPPVSGKVQTAVRELGLAVPQLRQLAKTVLDCPGLADKKQWGVLHEKLPSGLKAKFPLEVEAVDRETELIHFFTSIWKDEEGMAEWLAALQRVERNRGAFHVVEDKINCLRKVNEVRRRLGNLMITTLELRQFYRRSAPDPQRAPEADDLDQVLENLWNMPPRTGGGILPLLEFVERVAQCYNRTDLSDLVKDTASYPQQVADLRRYLDWEKNSGTTACEHLLIDIPSATSTQMEYWFHSWNRERDDHGKIGRGAGVEDICSALTEILETISSISAGSTGDLLIEFFLPLDMLSCAADQWRVKLCEGIEPRLGTLYPVLLRWRDRKPITRSYWIKVANIIRRRDSLNMPLEAYWLDPNKVDNPAKLVSQICLGDYGTCIGFSFVPLDAKTQRLDPLLVAALHGGTPFAFWVRQSPSNWQAFKTSIENILLAAEKLDNVPHQVKEFRRQANDLDRPDYVLTLFWDDPDRNPLAVQYPATIPQRGVS